MEEVESEEVEETLEESEKKMRVFFFFDFPTLTFCLVRRFSPLKVRETPRRDYQLYGK